MERRDAFVYYYKVYWKFLSGGFPLLVACSVAQTLSTGLVAPQPLSDPIRSVAGGEAAVLAVGKAGAGYHSADASSWTKTDIRSHEHENHRPRHLLRRLVPESDSVLRRAVCRRLFGARLNRTGRRIGQSHLRFQHGPDEQLPQFVFVQLDQFGQQNPKGREW